MKLPALLYLASALLGVASVTAALTPPSSTPPSRPDELLRAAQVRLDQDTIEDRRLALEYLSEAARLAPTRADITLALARALDTVEHTAEARQAYRRAAQLDPRNPEAYAALEISYRSEWLRNFDPAMLDSAIACAEHHAMLRPYSVDAWVRLVPLWTERGDASRAAEATDRAMRYAKRRPEPLLAYGGLSWRQGETARADSAFRAALPKLPRDLQAWFTDLSRIGTSSEAYEFASLDARSQAAFADSFWSRLDPDPFTPESEARIEYWARVAQAVLLFYDPRRGGMDARADLYVRYGPPRQVDYNPMGVPLDIKFNRFDMVGKWGDRRQSIASYPVQVQSWTYPEYGMRVLLQDRSLRGVYEPALARDFDPNTVPNPKMLAALGDLMQTGGGRALFSSQPPRMIRMDVRGVLARFRSGASPLLHVELEAPGAPGDTVSARWRIEDLSGRPVREGIVPFGTSACEPTEKRTATISESIPAGDYRMVISAQGPDHRRGLLRFATTTKATPAALDMSDVVVTCGEPLGGARAVEFDADFDRAVHGNSPLTAYFEAYGLKPDGSGLSRFEYEVRVASRQENPSVWRKMLGMSDEVGRVAVHREETQTGPVRRQFLSVPMASLPTGRYRLWVRVRDLVSGAEVTRDVEFAKL